MESTAAGSLQDHYGHRATLRRCISPQVAIIMVTAESHSSDESLALGGLSAAACRPRAGPAVLLDSGALHGVLDSHSSE